MSDRHLRDLDRGVVLALRSLALRPEASTDAVARLLHRHWWLGLAPRASRVPPQRPSGAGSTSPPWRTWGERWDHEHQSHEPLLRLYLATAPGTALQTVATVTHRAQSWHEPWLLTSRGLARQVPAPDATALLIPATSLPPLRGRLDRLVDELRPLLATRTPLLTLPVARGVGLAEVPAQTSFGWHRCRLVAEAVRVHRGHPLPLVQRAALAAFWDAGIDPRRPYRSVDAAWHWHGEPARVVA